MKKLSIFLLVVTGLFLAVACGGDDDGAPISTSVDESKASSELTAEEASTVCEDLYNGMIDATEDLYADNMDVVCAGSGYSAAVMAYMMSTEEVADADLVAACEEAVTACQNAPTTTEEVDVETLCAAAQTYIGECTVTVGEIVDCMNAQLDASESAMSEAAAATPDCAEITGAMIEASMTTEPVEPTTPSACQTVYTDCPAIESMAAN